MDASLDRFYQTMHSIGQITYEDLDNVLCRLTHNVKNIHLENMTYFLDIIDHIGITFSQNSSNFTS
jgi:hypothetical protein